MIGYAIFDYKAFEEWKIMYQAKEFGYHVPCWYWDMWEDYFYTRQSVFRDCINVFEACDNKKLKSLITHLTDIGEKLQLFYYDDTACIIGYEDKRFVMNSDFVTPEYLEDYSKLTASEMKKLTGAVSESSFLPAELDTATVENLTDKKNSAEQDIKTLEEEMKKQEAAIREEMYRKIEEMKAQMSVKLDEYRAIAEKCKKEIFILESQIFSIRCYTGEVVKFHQIKNGKPASQDTPLVLYQKIRFLDEELGKHIAIFDFNGEEDTRLIPLLQARDDIAKLFAPGERSLTILRTSRTGRFIAANENIKNMLAEYDQYHGMQLALLLRDGEKLYIAWCDADNIKINEENAFYSLSVQTEMRGEDEDASITERTTDIHEALSRYYLLAILQGVIDAGQILKFPEAVNVLDPAQKYIIYSLAKGWVTSDKYGSLEQMLEKSKDIALRKGDRILTIMGLRPDGSGRAYDNDRGIGYANRTSGVRIAGKKIYPVNLVLYDAIVRYEYEAVKVTEEMTTKDVRHIKDNTAEIIKEPDIKYTVTDKVLFTGSGSTTIPYETFREFKKDDTNKIKMYVIHDIIAVGHNDYVKPAMYYKENEHEIRHNKPDTFRNQKIQLSGKELYAKHVTSVTIEHTIPHMFVSVKQNGYGSYQNGFKDTEYHVNFEVMHYEYIPATFLCSSWINEVITTGNIGDIRFPGARPSFADLLPYLHILKEELEEREKNEKLLLIQSGGEAFLDTHDDWDANLCEWKIKNQIHELTKARAKKFLKEQT